MKLIFSLCLSAVLVSACSKKEADPQPTDPEVESTLTRTLTFPTSPSRNSGLTYTQKSMGNAGKLDTKELVLAFDVPEGSDYISFTVPVAALAANLQGTYQIQDRPKSPNTVVETRYVYTRLNVPGALSGQLYLSSTNDMRGQLVVTTYDSQRRLLSGSFDMTMDGVSDPTERSTSGTGPLCNVRIVGTFTNLKLK